MGRIYSVVFGGVAVTAQQDFFEIIGAASKVVIVHEIRLSQSSDAGDAQSEQLRIALKRWTGAYTSGSGGSSPTPRPFDPGDAAATFTAEVNNTTKVTGGTNVILLEDSFNVVGPGWQFLPTPECRPVLVASSCLTVTLETTPGDSLTMQGFAICEEIG